ncbi:MAG: hypothetical protein HOO91_19015 [Bacteroidales bacterium]|nr:hypothetical protein [Bacteroidales bacterium]
MSCKQDVVNQVKQNSLEEFSKKNVAFYDARIRSINKTSYVRELYFKNFSDEPLRVQTTYFNEDIFVDNGQGNDLVANDGVFTSTEVFSHDTRIPYDSFNSVRSVLKAPVVHPNFQQSIKLAAHESNYSIRKRPNNQKIMEVTCDITFGGGGCNACDWFGGGWCNYCFRLSDCSITIGF